MGAPSHFTRGSVIYGPFPFSVSIPGDATGKNRPALIINRTSGGDLLAAQITSKQTSKDSYSVDLDNTDFTTGSLAVPSLIRVDKLFVIDGNASFKKVGEINPTKLAEVTKRIVAFVSGVP